MCVCVCVCTRQFTHHQASGTRTSDMCHQNPGHSNPRPQLQCLKSAPMASELATLGPWLSSGWQQVGNMLATGWQQVGNRLAAGWQHVGN